MSVMKGMTNDNDYDIMNDERHAARVRDMHALNSHCTFPFLNESPASYPRAYEYKKNDEVLVVPS